MIFIQNFASHIFNLKKKWKRCCLWLRRIHIKKVRTFFLYFFSLDYFKKNLIPAPGVHITYKVTKIIRLKCIWNLFCNHKNPVLIFGALISKSHEFLSCYDVWLYRGKTQIHRKNSILNYFLNKKLRKRHDKNKPIILTSGLISKSFTNTFWIYFWSISL